MLFPSLRASVVLGVVAIASFSSPVLADCAYGVLVAAADKYVTAQGSGQLGDLGTLLLANYTYQENNKVTTVKAGVLSKALTISHRKTTADTVACASYTELIALTPSPYVIGVQLRHTADGLNITMIDVIAATTGSLSFNAAQTQKYIVAENWTTLDPSVQPTRAQLQQVADAYLDMWSNSSAYNAVPWGTPCERVEGSALNSPCTNGAPHGGYAAITMRRYVFDPTLGSSNVFCDFAAVGSVADSHEFRLENGKLRYVHTITL